MTGATSRKRLVSRLSWSRVPECLKCFRALLTSVTVNIGISSLLWIFFENKQTNKVLKLVYGVRYWVAGNFILAMTEKRSVRLFSRDIVVYLKFGIVCFVRKLVNCCPCQFGVVFIRQKVLEIFFSWRHVYGIDGMSQFL